MVDLDGDTIHCVYTVDGFDDDQILEQMAITGKNLERLDKSDINFVIFDKKVFNLKNIGCRKFVIWNPKGDSLTQKTLNYAYSRNT